ncbi:hypothetical protein BKA64DRAFT_110777 [Cadophora sp. MPI-SDFR-AT-0126]|nr:hypothetical protein BKA64DRAFT_110777 [Leotiomycetes sp. MPI-SDFR-AT-0126]
MMLNKAKDRTPIQNKFTVFSAMRYKFSPATMTFALFILHKLLQTHTTNSFAANMASGNHNQDPNAMDIDIDMDIDDNDSEQDFAQDDLSSSVEQLSFSALPPPTTLAKMLGRHVLETIKEAESDALQYAQEREEERANDGSDPNTDSSQVSEPDTGPVIDLKAASTFNRPNGLSWDFSALDLTDTESGFGGEQNLSRPLTDVDVMYMAIAALNDGTIRSQVNKSSRRAVSRVGPSPQDDIGTKTARMVRSDSVTKRRQVSLPFNTDESRRSRDMAHRRVMGEAKVCKR